MENELLSKEFFKMENELRRIKEFEIDILKEVKKSYSYNRKIKVTVTRKFYRYKDYIIGSITVDSKILFISDFIKNEILTNALQDIKIKDDKIEFNIVSKLP